MSESKAHESSSRGNLAPKKNWNEEENSEDEREDKKNNQEEEE